MQLTVFRIACLTGALLVPAGFLMRAAAPVGETLENHARQLDARITFRDGTSRTARVEGVGCSQSMCSRTAIKARDGSHGLISSSFDSLAAINNTTADVASFISKNGTERQLSLVNSFRVLYLRSQFNGTEKLDLKSIRSVEFLPVQQ